jgi:hypothetical protein
MIKQKKKDLMIYLMRIKEFLKLERISKFNVINVSDSSS